MKKTTIKYSSLSGFLILLSAISACGNLSSKSNDSNINQLDQVAQMRLHANKGIGTDCNIDNTQQDVTNPVNHGQLDDRNCKFDYKEVTFDDSPLMWGKYELTENSSTDARNYTRMERKFAPRLKPHHGNYHRFVGTFRIADVEDNRGTYFIQAKGKHVNSKGDPAIALFQARKRVINGELYFDLIREQITKRDGRFSNGGRKDIFLTRVKALESFRVEMITGFTYKNNEIDRHYVNVKINDTWYNYDVPEPKLATETGLRYGAYEVRTGHAEIYVADTFFEKK